MRGLAIRRVGVIGYSDALELQRELVEQRKLGQIPDTLLLLQHHHVVTIGVRKGGGQSHIVATPERLRELGVGVFETGRGGDVTYHGPGQIVGYPILDLRPDRQDVHRYVRDLEEVMIRVCRDFQVPAGRERGLTGTWVQRDREISRKIGAIGVRISRWITSHGFAFNVNTDLRFFDLIVPCGIVDRGVTSLWHETGSQQDMDAVEELLARHFADVFEREATEAVSGRAGARLSGLQSRPANVS